MGANVIAGASSDQRLELCRAHGAQTTINYSTEDLRARIDELTARRGVDMVYDPVGGSLAETALRSTAWRGRYLVVGFAAGEIPKIALNLALLRERAILGVFWGDAMRREPALLKSDIKTLVAWFKEGKVRPDVQERVGLAGAADAIARMANRQVIGKVVVLPQS
jgi:NADPH2:quinone reductase